MKKELFLSFNPKYFKPLLYGLKKYEYRKRFCDEETIAYLYLSQKIQKVIGIVELGTPLKLENVIKELDSDSDVFRRVDNYLRKGNKNAVPIKSLQLFKRSISLDEIRKEIPNFRPPQMYYLLDNHQKLQDLMHKQEVDKVLLVHDHEKIYLDNLALSCREIEQTEKYKSIDRKFNHDKKIN